MTRLNPVGVTIDVYGRPPSASKHEQSFRDFDDESRGNEQRGQAGNFATAIGAPDTALTANRGSFILRSQIMNYRFMLRRGKA
jgi:hypothetical protein